MHMELANCLPGLWPVIQPNVETIRLWPETGLQVSDTPIHSLHQTRFFVCGEFLKSDDRPSRDDETVTRRYREFVAHDGKQIVRGEDSSGFNSAK